MKKSIKKICILSIILLLISTITILLCGKTYTIIFKIKENNINELEIDNKADNIEVINQIKTNNYYKIKVKSKKPGKVSFYLNHGDYKEGKEIYVHKNMIITEENYFGKSTASEVIPISITIILIYILYLLIKGYTYSIKENLYQYKNISYLGIIIFLSFFFLNNLLSIFNYKGLSTTINDIINSISIFSTLLFPIAIVTFILVTISNIKLIRKEGKSLKNLLGLFLGIFVCLSTLLPNYAYIIILESQKIDIFNLNSFGPYLYNFIESLVYLSISYLECVLLGTIIIAIKSVKKKVDYNKDYMIILGCQIKKDGSLTPLLKSRVDKALEFRNKQLESTGKDLTFIASGGKGNDEIISEAEAIKNYLIEQGINKNKILLDNKSTNTFENIKFSNELIKEKNAQVAYSTTNYHVLRTGLIATGQGLYFEGIGSKTKSYFWINAFIREFIGTLYSERKKHIFIIILITLTIILMISITYIANNI